VFENLTSVNHSCRAGDGFNGAFFIRANATIDNECIFAGYYTYDFDNTVRCNPASGVARRRCGPALTEYRREH